MKSFTKLSIAALTLNLAVFASQGFAADKNASVANEKRSKEARGVKEVSTTNMAKVTGIGGIFFKAKKNQKELADWYTKNLGITLEPWGGAIFRWTDDKASDGGVTVWHAKEANTDPFSPSHSNFMINYRIDNMDKMVKQLKANGVTIVQGPESHENGKFLWIMDPDGNKVELWEPMIWDEKNKKL
jgi:predicted enzyme related to lactoylglutathione lyase